MKLLIINKINFTIGNKKDSNENRCYPSFFKCI